MLKRDSTDHEFVFSMATAHVATASRAPLMYVQCHAYNLSSQCHAFANTIHAWFLVCQLLELFDGVRLMSQTGVKHPDSDDEFETIVNLAG
jgi:hypothetical protein